jgi:hypothetical protein
MGKVNNRLNRTLYIPVANFIEHERDNYRQGERKNKLCQAYNQSIPENPEKIDRLKKRNKMDKPDPGASPYTFERAEISKRDLRPVHGHITEKDEVDYRRNGHKYEIPAAPKTFVRTIQSYTELAPAFQAILQTLLNSRLFQNQPALEIYPLKYIIFHVSYIREHYLSRKL